MARKVASKPIAATKQAKRRSAPKRSGDRNRTRERRGAAARPIVVGVGASAGGLDAFRRFFRNMPPDSGLAFVLIQHLDPTHESLTAELISRCTPMPAVQVEGDTPVVPDHIYVIPPNRYLRIENGILRLSTPPEPRGMRMPIDVFLRSLSVDQEEKATCCSSGGSVGLPPRSSRIAPRTRASKAWS